MEALWTTIVALTNIQRYKHLLGQFRPSNNIDMPTTNTAPTSKLQGSGPKMPGGVKLPLEIILMVFDHLSLEEVFLLLDVGAMRETLVAKLNKGHPLYSDQLEDLSQHREVYGRLTKLNVNCVTNKDIILLENICRWCPNLQDLTLHTVQECLLQLKNYYQILTRLTELTVTIYEEDGVYSLEEVCQRYPELSLKLNKFKAIGPLEFCSQILERLTNLEVFYPTMEDLSSLRGICSRYPIKIEIILDRSLLQPLARSPDILTRLTSLTVGGPRAEDLVSLATICNRHPMKLYLCISSNLGEIIDYPRILKPLKSLTVIGTVQVERLDWLNDVCKMAPHLSELSFWMKGEGGLQRVMKHHHLLAPLTELDVILHDKDDCFRFKKLCEQCHKLVRYGLSADRALLMYLQDCPMMVRIGTTGDFLAVNGDQFEKTLEIQCEPEHLYAFAQVGNLVELKKLVLNFTGNEDVDEASTFLSLEDVSKKSPGLEKLAIYWRSPREFPPRLARRLGEATKNWKSLQYIITNSEGGLETILRQEWAKAGFGLAVTAEWFQFG